jgi:hypothetical protein
VHDKTTNPPSTFSTGNLAPPSAVSRELWAAEDLRTGDLSRFKSIANHDASAFVIQLTSAEPVQRFEGWYLDPSELPTLLDEVSARAKPGTVRQYQDTDAGRARVLVAFVPLGA